MGRKRENNPIIKKSDIQPIKDSLKDYTILISFDAQRNDNGTIDFVSDSEMRSNLKIIDAFHNEYTPLEDKDISAKALIYRDWLTRIFTATMGELGKGSHVYYFKTGKEVNTTHALNSGSFKVILDGTQFSWHLPLPCMLPIKYCPIDEMEMHGDWLYCPYHGVKLDNTK